MINKIKNMILERLKSEFDGFELHDKWYKAGAMAFLLYFVVSCFLLLFFGQYSVKEAANLFVYVLYFIFTIAVVIEYWKKVISYYSKVWFKFLLAALSFIVYKYSELHADDFINEFTLNEPSYFPVASVLLTAMFLIYSWLLFVSIILLIFAFINWIFIPLEKNNKRQLESWKYIARFLGVLVISMCVYKLTKPFEDKDSIVYSMAYEAVLSSEYFKNSHCQNVKDNELSAYLDRGYISIYSKGTGLFRTESCKL